SAEAAPVAPVQRPEGGRAVAALPGEASVALGGRSRAGTSPSVERVPTERSVASTVAAEPVEYQATPAGGTPPQRAQTPAAAAPSAKGAVVRTPDRTPVRERGPDRAGATAT